MTWRRCHTHTHTCTHDSFHPLIFNSKFINWNCRGFPFSLSYFLYLWTTPSLYLSNCVFYSIKFLHSPITLKFAYQTEEVLQVFLLFSLLSKLSDQEHTFSLCKVKQTRHSTLPSCSPQDSCKIHSFFNGWQHGSKYIASTGLCF